MKIIVGGAGSVGRSIIGYLSRGSNDIVVVDINQERLNEISREFDVQPVLGSISHPDVQEKIGAKTADIFGFSKKYFSAMFAKNMQINFTDYLTEIRIKHAVEILEKNKLSVAELAEKCGYTDPLYFSKVFKKITGFSPSKYYF